MRNVSASRILICNPQLTQKSGWREGKMEDNIKTDMEVIGYERVN
jgi:hypothetical protein